jgi:hypothetical protein
MPSSSVCSTMPATRSQVSLISLMYFAFGSPAFRVSAIATGTFPHRLTTMTQGLEPGFESGYPDCGRPHIHAAARLAQIEGHAEDADLARRKGLHPTVRRRRPRAARIRSCAMPGFRSLAMVEKFVRDRSD